MALTFKIFSDVDLATEQTGNLVATQNADGSTPPVDFQLWFGSLGSAGGNTTDRKAEADSDPGVDDLTITPIDSAPGSGHEFDEVTIADSQANLDIAVAGLPHILGQTIISGTGNAVEFWVRVDDATNTIGTSTELSVDTVLLKETTN